MERDPELVKVDCDRGLVTREGAARYGVVIGDDGTVDQSATKKLRAELTENREDKGLFNRGGTIEELVARAEEETHLPPPQRPNA